MSEIPDVPTGAVPQEVKSFSEIRVQPFNPENPKEVESLHQIDLATRETTVDVTGAEEEISPEDLREWMTDPLLLALEGDGNVFGFTWLTPDTNLTANPQVAQTLELAGFPTDDVRELSHGELESISDGDIHKGMAIALDQYASTRGKQQLVLTSYTTDVEEGKLLESLGFLKVATVPAYYAEMDDGSVSAEEEPHDVYVLRYNAPGQPIGDH